MLLRSSSTPVLGSLLSSFSDSPSNSHNYHYSHDTANHILKNHQSLHKLPYHQTGRQNLTTISCNSSPISPSFAEFSNHSQTGIRRTQSEGNLEGLPYASCKSNEGNYNSSQPKKFSGRPKGVMLDTIPSFSFYNSRGLYEDDDDVEIESGEQFSDIGDDKEDKEQWNENSAVAGAHFGLSNKTENLLLSEKVIVMDRIWNADFQEKRSLDSEELHLAKGLGIDGGITNGNGGGCGRRGGGSGGEFNSVGGDGEYIHGPEEYYKRLIQENPGNALFLRNYAQFLYQSKQDLRGAEEYYSRAILADPSDGEILSQYAKLVWEQHHDQDRASTYFEHAVQASPEDSHVHAAYASFLWETEEDSDECNVANDLHARSSHFQGAVASAGA